jgi:hypothetical protein
VTVQWRARVARFALVGQVRASGASAIVAARVRVPGPGQVRLVWGGYASRWVTIGG